MAELEQARDEAWEYVEEADRHANEARTAVQAGQAEFGRMYDAENSLRIRKDLFVAAYRAWWTAQAKGGE